MTERYRCCDHCRRHGYSAPLCRDDHRVPCAVEACGRKTPAQQLVVAE